MIENITVPRSRVEMVPISKLKMHPKNVEIYGEEDVTALKQSIAESGWIKPPTVDEGYTLLSGHRRTKAALELGYTELSVEVETFVSEEAKMERLLRENENRSKSPEQQIREGMTWEPIEKRKAERRLEEGQKSGGRGHKKDQNSPQNFVESFDIIAQRVGLGSGENYRKGRAIVVKIDIELAAGDLKERGKLLRMKLNDESINAATKLMQNYKQLDDEETQRQEEEEEERLKQEEEERLRQEAIIKKEDALRPKGVQPGQIWQLGRHLLYCGDSASEQFVTLCKQSGANFVFADPPYNAGVAEWDHDFSWNHDYLYDIAPLVAVTPGIAAIKDFMRVTKMPYRWSMSYWIDNGMTRGAVGFGNWIYVALFTNGSLYRNAQDLIRIAIDDKHDVERISIAGNDHDELKHKGRKPIRMVQDIIRLFTKEDETIVDPFLGTGTTLIASEFEGRSCVGAELNVEYCEYIIKRWAVQTDQEAVLL